MTPLTGSKSQNKRFSTLLNQNLKGGQASRKASQKHPLPAKSQSTFSHKKTKTLFLTRSMSLTKPYPTFTCKSFKCQKPNPSTCFQQIIPCMHAYMHAQIETEFPSGKFKKFLSINTNTSTSININTIRKRLMAHPRQTSNQQSNLAFQLSGPSLLRKSPSKYLRYLHYTLFLRIRAFFSSEKPHLSKLHWVFFSSEKPHF